MTVPREPNLQEKRELAVLQLKQFYRNYPCNPPSEIREAVDQVRSASIAVFDHYITDGPGYAGKVMVVVWSGDPAYHDVFIWRDERLVPVSQQVTGQPDHGAGEPAGLQLQKR